MTIVKYKKTNPVLRSLLDDVWGTSMFDNTLFTDQKWVPSVNIKETDKNYFIELMVPGFDKKDFHIHAENGVLTIEAEVKSETETTEEKYTRREFSFNSFTRSFNLPENGPHCQCKKCEPLLKIFELRAVLSIIYRPANHFLGFVLRVCA